MADEKSPLDQAIQQALDVLVYAPVGAALSARDELPRFIAKGRERVQGQLTLAKMFGQFAVAQGQREAQKALERLREQAIEQATRLAGTASTPSPSPPRPSRDASQTGAAAAAVRSAGATNGSGPRPDAPPAADLAIPGYDSLSASQVVQRLAGLSTSELEAVRRYETATRGRRTILSKVSQLQSGQ